VNKFPDDHPLGDLVLPAGERFFQEIQGLWGLILRVPVVGIGATAFGGRCGR
jgi:hypothetical protein